jgi:hypothetical protein|tara:strand:- start:1851 stop:2657 length:807 start_codon:yes stop_codon:yes gene_type:complete
MINKLEQVVRTHYTVGSEDTWKIDRWEEDTYENMIPSYHTDFKGGGDLDLPNKYRSNIDTLSLYRTDMVFNEHWFRSDTFDTDDDGILFLGCSLTMGVGIDDEQLVWPWRVGKHFDMKVWNLGMAAQGEDMCFLLGNKWIPKLKPKAVCMLIPPIGRYFFTRPKDVEWLEWKKEPFWFRNNQKCFTRNNREMFMTLYEKQNLYYNTLKDIYSIKSICNDLKIPFIVESYERWIDYEKHGNAKDNHPGPLYHEWVSEFFIKELNESISN